MTTTTTATGSGATAASGGASEPMTGAPSMDQVKEVAAVASSAVSQRSHDLLSDLGEQARVESERQKLRAAQGIRGVGEQLRSLSLGNPPQNGEQVSRVATEVVGIAADRVEQLAGYVEQTEPRDWWGQLQSFARREPAAFAVAGIATGVALERVVRAMRSSAQTSRADSQRFSGAAHSALTGPSTSYARTTGEGYESWGSDPTEREPIDLRGSDESLTGASSTGADDDLLGAGSESDVHVTSQYNPAP